MTIRAMTLLNESGDTTIAWTEDDDEKWIEVIQKKMAEGVTFFIITPRFGGWLPSKIEELKKPTDALKSRAVLIRDADISGLVDAGHGAAVATPAANVGGSKLSRDPAEVAKSESVGVKQVKGG